VRIEQFASHLCYPILGEMASAGNDGVVASSALDKLMTHRCEIDHWLELVQNKIYEVESSYLADQPTSIGNLIKGLVALQYFIECFKWRLRLTLHLY